MFGAGGEWGGGGGVWAQLELTDALVVINLECNLECVVLQN